MSKTVKLLARLVSALLIATVGGLCLNQYIMVKELSNATGHKSIIVTGLTQAEYNEILKDEKPRRFNRDKVEIKDIP